MRILHISNSVSNQSAAYRLHKALLKENIESLIYVKDKSIENKKIIREKSRVKNLFYKIRMFIENKIVRYIKICDNDVFSMGILSAMNKNIINNINPDIIHIHWACGQFISYSDYIFLSRYNVVWTLHDSWGFTGGCHIPLDCLKYYSGCKKCEKIKKKYSTVIKYLFNKKLFLYSKINFYIITPSFWLGKCAKNSLLLKDKNISVIGNAINTEFFRNVDKSLARDILGLPQNRHIILFGAVNSLENKLKGFQYLLKAVELLNKNNNTKEINLAIFGNRDRIKTSFKTYYFGFLNDDISLKILYSAADVFVLPSMSENLPNVIMEAMSCGTPCVAFNVGGISDMIEHKKNGYLAEPFDINDLSRGIEYILKNDSNNFLGIEARNKIINYYSEQEIAKKHIKLYKTILEKAKEQ